MGVRDEAIGHRWRGEEGSAIQRTLHTRSLWQENGKEYFILFWGKGGVNCAVLLKPGKHLINRSKGKGGRGGRKKSCERKEEGVRGEEEVGVEKVSSCEWEDGGEKRGEGEKMKPFFCLFSQLTLLRSIEAPFPSLTISKRGISTSPLSFPKPFEHTREKGEREIGFFFFFYLHISLDSKDRRRRPGVISCLLACLPLQKREEHVHKEARTLSHRGKCRSGQIL